MEEIPSKRGSGPMRRLRSPSGLDTVSATQSLRTGFAEQNLAGGSFLPKDGKIRGPMKRVSWVGDMVEAFTMEEIPQ